MLPPHAYQPVYEQHILALVGVETGVGVEALGVLTNLHIAGSGLVGFKFVNPKDLAKSLSVVDVPILKAQAKTLPGAKVWKF